MPPAQMHLPLPALQCRRIAQEWRWLRCVLLGLVLAMLGACGSLPPNKDRTESHALADPANTPLGQMARTLQRQADTHQNSAFVLLDTADSAYAARLALTQQATRTLDLQYYAIHADPSARSLLRAIRAAAQRGVRVRILLDDFNSKGMDAQVLRMAFVPNVEMRLFNPLPGGRGLGALRALTTLTDFKRLQHRMHNKLYLADNALGIAGGRNLGDAYFGQSANSNFIDLDVLAMGALVQDMSASFDRYWNHPLAYPVQTLISRQQLDMLRQAEQRGSGMPATDRGGAAPVAASTATLQDAFPPPMLLRDAEWDWAPSALLVDTPAKLEAEDSDGEEGVPQAEPTVVDGMLGLMQHAQERVLIVSPYFVPGQAMLRVFASLRQRGVRIQVLTNSLAATDAPAAHIGYARHRKQLLHLGVELHEMRALQPQSVRGAFGSSGKASRASLHAKMVVVDDDLLSIGSMNLDQRSNLQNSEVAILIRSEDLATQIDARITPILQQSAWRLGLTPAGRLVWHAPPHSSLQDQRHEPDATLTLQILLKLAAPFAPDELL